MIIKKLKMLVLKLKVTNYVIRFLRPFYKPLRNKTNLNLIDQLIVERFHKNTLSLKNQIVIDLGANRGDFSCWALEQKALVIAFEPDSEAFRHLVKRLKSYPNFFPLNVAVSNRTGIEKLFMHKNRSSDPLGHSISSSLLISKLNIDPNIYNMTFCIDFEVIVSNFQIRLLKVDIEGAEEIIWNTIEKNYRKIDYLVMEVHKTVNKEFLLNVSNFIAHNRLGGNWKIDWI
jgi:FkbM family methyltransferase